MIVYIDRFVVTSLIPGLLSLVAGTSLLGQIAPDHAGAVNRYVRLPAA